MGPGEEQGGAEAERGDAVAVSLGDSGNHAVQAEVSQVIGHAALGDWGGNLPGEHSYLLAKIAIGKATRQKTKPDKAMPQGQHAEVGGAQGRGALPVDFQGTVQLMQGFFSYGTVVAETFDFEKTSV